MPSERFQQYVARNLAHWRQRLEAVDDPRLDELVQQRQTIYRALEAGLSTPSVAPETARLAHALFLLVERGGHWPECLPLLERAAAAVEADDPCLAAGLLIQLGHLRRQGDDLAGAIATHTRAEALAAPCDDLTLLGRAWNSLSDDYRRMGELEAAEQAGQRALALFTAAQAEPGRLAGALNALGLIAWMRGDRPLAISRLREAADCLQQTEQINDLVRCLNNLANALAQDGQPEAALACFDEARAVLARAPRLADQVMLDNSQGTLYFNLGRLAEAEAAFRRADSPALRQSPYTRERAITATNLGNVLQAQGHWPQAEASFRGALALWQPLEEPVMEANVLGTLAEVLYAQGQVTAALAALDEAALRVAADHELDFARRLAAKFARLRDEWTATSGARAAGAAPEAPAG